MSKKVFIILLSMVFSLCALAGCGAGGAEESSVSETENANEENAGEDALPSGDVTLRVWGSEEDDELINQIISSFISEYSSQANFNIIFELKLYV